VGGKNLVDLASKAQRQQLVDWEHGELPISTQAQLLGLNRTGLYYQPVPHSAR
jgi:putative transposase